MVYLWYDLETSGRNPGFDRILQFAAIRTDEQFNIVDDPVELYGKLSPDYLPDPGATLVHGISPQQSNARGLCEADLARAAHELFSRPGTCSLGYNSFNFDDEFIRNLLYRNFYDPYRREWAEGNSRWDMLNVARATGDLRPEGMEWPLNEDGRKTYSLGALTQANGLDHEHAHDALSDVRAVIALARLIQKQQPRLFDWALQHRSREALRTLIDLDRRTPLVHTSSYLRNPHGNTSLVAPLVVDPQQRNIVQAFDLRQDPHDLLTVPMDELRHRIFTSSQELEAEGTSRIALIRIALNKSPFLAPVSVLDKKAEERLGIDREQAMKHWETLRQSPELLARLREAFGNSAPRNKVSIDDPDMQLYSRFFPDDDTELFKRIRNTEPGKLTSLRIKAKDSRIPEMLRRYIGRNWPDELSAPEQERWKSFCASRILFPPVPGVSDLGEYKKRLRAWIDSETLPAEKKPLIKELEQYCQFLEHTVLGKPEKNKNPGTGIISPAPGTRQAAPDP